MKLTKEEKEILESVEKGEWRPVRNQEKDMRQYQAAARATMCKVKRVKYSDDGARSNARSKKCE